MSDFDTTTRNPELVDLLRERIEREGPITFHDYMETVLYHPHFGYYATRRPVGRAGDYLTSPEVHAVFGALVAKQIAQFWELLDRPARFDLVEQGAGSGRLAGDILRWSERLRPDFAGALRYRIVEISASLGRAQQERLARYQQVDWLDDLPDGIEGCILSNELLDSFAVHRVRAGLVPNSVPKGERNLFEVWVGWRDGHFVEEVGPTSTGRIEGYFAQLGITPPDACTVEVNLHAVDWAEAAAKAIRRGFVLTFDYGYEARELYAPWRKDGTLMCFYRHNPSTDPYARVGKQDMTAHVDFTTLQRVGRESGLTTSGLTTQARFLTALEIGAGLQEVAAETPEDLEEYYARRRAVQELLDPAGLGRIRVLAQSRGVDDPELIGFSEPDGA
jgi:SAM-dependent MidA family methyltransferase